MSAPAGEGGCACRAVRYQLTSKPMIVDACHCRDCQRITGGVFAVDLWTERQFVEPSGDEPVAFSVPPGITGRPNDVFRCRKCGTAVWHKYHALPGDTVLLCGGSLDEAGAVTPDVHIFTHSKVPWLQLPEDARVFEGDYRRDEVWSPESRARWRALLA